MYAGVMKLVNMRDSKSRAARLEGSSPSPGTKENHAFIIGVALGDGNLSNPNGRAVRLRVTCDTKYLKNIQEIYASISLMMPNNKVSLVARKDNCVDISCYSNKWEDLLLDGQQVLAANTSNKHMFLTGLLITNNITLSVYVD